MDSLWNLRLTIPSRLWLFLALYGLVSRTDLKHELVSIRLNSIAVERAAAEHGAEIRGLRRSDEEFKIFQDMSAETNGGN